VGQASTDSEQELLIRPNGDESLGSELEDRAAREHMVVRLRLLWGRRAFLLKVSGYGLLLSTLVAFLIPKSYQSTARLMPPDNQSGSGMAMLAALSSRSGTGLGAFAGDLLGLQSSGALFVGVLQSRTIEEGLVAQFDLKKVYGIRRDEDARKKLAENTSVSEDRKSGIISLTVTDHDPKRAAALANGYVSGLNRLVTQLTTSSAHRERVFLEERLKAVQQDLESAEKEFSQFASKNTTIDIKEQGKAMVDAAATLQGQLIAAQSEMEGLRQIYTDNNVRVRSVRARISELQSQLEKIGGKGESTTSAGVPGGDSMYPSIRKLPLLGVAYADLYRRTKVQEAVFETLTQEYELAKVEEAKEIPSVKVLDPADVPEKKTFPPRLVIMLLGTFLVFAFAVVWLLGSARWEETDAHDPGKVFAREVFSTLKADFSGITQNGSRLNYVRRKVFGRGTQGPDQPRE
jgi:capsule polysaccharide export protein KpsE/RkpR